MLQAAVSQMIACYVSGLTQIGRLLGAGWVIWEGMKSPHTAQNVAPEIRKWTTHSVFHKTAANVTSTLT